MIFGYKSTILARHCFFLPMQGNGVVVYEHCITSVIPEICLITSHMLSLLEAI